MPIKHPQERPDLYDSYDVRERDFEPTAAYREATMPSWMREAIVARARQPQAEADSPVLLPVGKVQMMALAPVVELVKQWPNRSSVTVVSLPANRVGDVEELRKSEIKALRDLADRLEHKSMQPGPLIVSILVES